MVSSVREPEDEQWGPEWSELLALKPLQPASKVALDNETIDLVQQFSERYKNEKCVGDILTVVCVVIICSKRLFKELVCSLQPT